MIKDLPVSLCIRKNLQRLRKLLKIKQEDIADVLGIKRSGYTKKETGITPITLDDLDKILDSFDPILLEDLLLGYPIATQPSGYGLSDETRKRFPFLEQIMLVANQVVDSEDKEDIVFLRQCLMYALKKIGQGESDD